MARTDGVKCMFFLVLCFLFDIFLFFYSRKRMALLPSPSKGPPDSPPLSSTTTVGKMYVNVLFFGIVFYLFDIFLFFYSRKRMVLLPSPLKGAPDSPPFSSTTTAGKMYVFSN